MATSQSPTHYRKGGQGCPPILRLPRCHWRMETSTSSKVPALGQMRKLKPREGRSLPKVKRGEASQFHSERVAPESLPGDSFSDGLGGTGVTVVPERERVGEFQRRV